MPVSSVSSTRKHRSTPRCARGLPLARRSVTGCGSSFRSLRNWARAPRPGTLATRHDRKSWPTGSIRSWARACESAQLVMTVEGKTAHAIFGFPDELKFRSSLTLFEQVAPEEPIFGQALAQYCHGERDSRTLALL